MDRLFAGPDRQPPPGGDRCPQCGSPKAIDAPCSVCADLPPRTRIPRISALTEHLPVLTKSITITPLHLIGLLGVLVTLLLIYVAVNRLDRFNRFSTDDVVKEFRNHRLRVLEVAPAPRDYWADLPSNSVARTGRTGAVWVLAKPYPRGYVQIYAFKSEESLDAALAALGNLRNFSVHRNILLIFTDLSYTEQEAFVTVLTSMR